GRGALEAAAMHLGDARAVPGDADAAHQALLPRLDERFERTARTQRRLPLAFLDQVVQLNQVDVVDAQAFERAMQALARGRIGSLSRLCSQEEALAMPSHPGTDAQLRVAVGCGGVDVIDAVLEEEIENLIGLFSGHTPERGGAE